MESRNHPIGPGLDRRKVPNGLALDGAVGLVRELLDLVRLRTSFDLVMVTRVVGEEWRVVEVTDNAYGVAAGDVLRWSDSICSRMVAGTDAGPWALPDVAATPVAAAAPVRTRLDIASYAGVPLLGATGSVLGTLCAIDPSPRSSEQERDLLTFAQSFASWTLRLAADSAPAQRAAERRLLGTSGGALDAPRATWSSLLESELQRSRWSGDTPVIALLRSVSAGRAWPAQRLADAMRARLGGDDATAVLGTNRVGVLSVHDGSDGLADLIDHLGAEVAPHGVRIVSVLGELAGAETAATIVAALESTLVGEAAAAARQASTALAYEFCDACGRKGRYLIAGGRRCKYCGVVDL